MSIKMTGMARERFAQAAPPRVRLLCRLVWLACVPIAGMAAEKDQFNTSFLRGASNIAQVADLDAGDDILPGTYPSDIFLNGQLMERRDVAFMKGGQQQRLAPCLSTVDLQAYGVRLSKEQLLAQCQDVLQSISGASWRYEAGVQRLELQVPQLYLLPRAQGEVSPKLYDNGINAAFVNYSLNGAGSRYRAGGADSPGGYEYYFANLHSGVNLGAWRLRNRTTLVRQAGNGGGGGGNNSTWAETDIVPWRSRVEFGQANSNNMIFDSFQFRGAQLSSTSDMLPESRRGYAPVVRGVAASNARVEIRQNGYTIYTTNVPPGPFELSDIYPGNLSGDLEVSVIEADGGKHQFNVPFSAVPSMLREGIWDYQLSAGQYRDGYSTYRPGVLRATLARGLPHDITPYAGLLLAQHYRSAGIGIGSNLGLLGALSLDLSYSKNELASGGSKRGTSTRFLYSQSLNSLGTELRIAGYRYSTSGYFDLADAVAERDSWNGSSYRNEYIEDPRGEPGVPDWAAARRSSYFTQTFNNKRQRLDISLNQRIRGGASIYLNAIEQSYWGVSRPERTLQAGFNSSYKQINYGIFGQYSRSRMGSADSSLNFTMSFALGRENSAPLQSNSSVGYGRYGGASYSTGLSGTLLDDHRLSYAVQASHSRESGVGGSANLAYQGRMGSADASYSYSGNFRQVSAGISGGIVAHGGGVTLTQPLQNTFVLVEAPQAQGVRLENQAGVAIDGAGYAVMTSAMPYRHNRVALRTEDIGGGLDIPMAAKDVVPTHGAIVKVVFETHSGQSLLVRSKLADGGLPPVGANVFGEDGRSRGVVGTNGDVFVAGVASGARLTVKWGEGGGEACILRVPVLQARQAAGYQVMALPCD